MLKLVRGTPIAKYLHSHLFNKPNIVALCGFYCHYVLLEPSNSRKYVFFSSVDYNQLFTFYLCSEEAPFFLVNVSQKKVLPPAQK